MRKPYTLVEILVTVSIIGILTATGLGVTSYVRNKIADTQTRTTIKLIEMALLKYYEKNSVYPIMENGSNGAFLHLPKISKDDWTDVIDSQVRPSLWGYFNDVTLQTNPGNAKIRGIKLEYDSSDKKYYVLDGWNRRLIYSNPGCFNNNSYDLISLGGDDCAGSDSNKTRIKFFAGQNFTNSNSDKTPKDEVKAFLDSNYPDELGDDITNFSRN